MGEDGRGRKGADLIGIRQIWEGGRVGEEMLERGRRRKVSSTLRWRRGEMELGGSLYERERMVERREAEKYCEPA